MSRDQVIRGIFLTIEGGEGVGKSSLIESLCQWISETERQVVKTREPGGTLMAQKIRELFAQPPDGEVLTMQAEAFLVSAARSQHCARFLAPQLNDGNIVICDRFADSTRVYQGYVGGLDDGFLEVLIKESSFGLEPDLTIILDCDVQVSMARVRSRIEDPSGTSRYDEGSKDLHEKLRQGFLEISRRFSERTVVIDAAQPADKVFEQAVNVLKERFPIG